jgi:dihydroflavonol-4-reductase
VKVLITGATGFLGTRLCRQMAAAGFQVTALHRKSSNLAALQGLNLKCRPADLDDITSLAAAVEGQEAVIHAAANIRYATSAAALERTNTEGTRALAQACRESGVRRLVHVSSVSAIGIPPKGCVADERFAFNLENSGLAYHLSKKRAEEAVFDEVGRGLDAVIVNPASLFGPHGRNYRGGEMIRKVLGSPLVPYFRGGICVAHADDVAAGIVAALERGRRGERYILGGENITYREIARRSAAALGVKPLLLPLFPLVTRAAMVLQPARFTYATHYTSSRFQFYSSEQARRSLGYRPRSFDEILQENLAFRSGDEAGFAPTPLARLDQRLDQRVDQRLDQ